MANYTINIKNWGGNNSQRSGYTSGECITVWQIGPKVDHEEYYAIKMSGGAELKKCGTQEEAEALLPEQAAKYPNLKIRIEKTEYWTVSDEQFSSEEEANDYLEDNSGWYSCIEGIGDTGLFGSTDTQGPFETVEEAIDDALDGIVTDLENQIDDADEDEADELRMELESVRKSVQAQVALLDTLTAQEVADEFGLAPSTVTRAAESGALPARQAGRIWLIRREDAKARWGKA